MQFIQTSACFLQYVYMQTNVTAVPPFHVLNGYNVTLKEKLAIHLPTCMILTLSTFYHQCAQACIRLLNIPATLSFLHRLSYLSCGGLTHFSFTLPAAFATLLDMASPSDPQ